MPLGIALGEMIATCKAEFEEKKTDPFCGTVYEARLDMLQYLQKRVLSGAQPEELLVELRARLAELEEAKEGEEISYTFDWYDDHYYYKIYDGQCEACRMVIDLLESCV